MIQDLTNDTYEKKINISNHAWNFGPRKNNFVKVSKIINKINKIKKIKKVIFKKSDMKETKILKLNSNKAVKNLKWKPKISFKEGIKLTFDWYITNKSYYKMLSKKDITKRLGK